MWGQRVACTRAACITRVLCTRGDWISWQPQYFGTSLVGSYVEAKDAMCGRRTIERFRSVGVWLGEDCSSIRHIRLTSVWQRACLGFLVVGYCMCKTWWFWSVMRRGSIKKVLQLLASASNKSKHKECNYDPTAKPSNRNVARCAGLFFQYIQTSAVSVAVWIPSSASTPQVGFASMATSSTWKEKSRFSGSSADRGGAVLRSSSWVFGTILRWL